MAAMARWCFQRRAWVLVGWLALLAVLGVTGRIAGSAYSDALTLPGTGSTTASRTSCGMRNGGIPSAWASSPSEAALRLSPPLSTMSNKPCR